MNATGSARRISWIVVLLTAGLAVAAIGGYIWIGAPAIEAAYRGDGWSWLQELMTRRDVPVEAYLAQGRLWLSRGLFLLVVLAAAVIGIIRRERVCAGLRAFFGASDEPTTLAVVRIVVFLVLFRMTKIEQAVWFGQMPEALRVPPFGSGWFAALVPTSEAWVRVAGVGLRAACVLAVVGLWTRPAAAIAAILAVYVLGIPQWFGKVSHYHHLVWFAALLAASPCGDALSVDALMRRRSAPVPSRAYALPLRFMWLLLGVLYFFPGFWKWWASGIDWVWSDNLKFWMYGKWAEGDGWMPLWRIDRWPLAYRLGGAATIVFEMGFFWCMFHPWARIAAAVAGLGFHRSTQMFMNIPFSHLWPVYVVFVDWGWVRRRITGWLGRPAAIVPTPSARRAAIWPTVVVGSTLLAGNFICGVSGFERAWPFACYPTFQSLKGPTTRSIQLEVTGGDGSLMVLDERRLRARTSTVRWKALVVNVLRADDESTQRARLRALWELWQKQEPSLADAREVRFFRVTRSLVPEQRSQPPLAKELVWVLPLVPTRAGSASHGGR